MNVLLIEKLQLVREGIAQILLAAGLKQEAIAAVEEISDAEELFEFFPANLIICSADYTDRDIHQLLEKFNTNSPQSDKALLFIHTTQPSYEIKAYQSIRFDEITRPFKREQLLEKLFLLTNSEHFAPKETVTTQKPQLNTPSERATVLVVDDEPSNIDVIKGLLQDNYRVLAATSAAQALKIIETSNLRIDLILLDIMMPEVDGYQLCKELKSDQRYSDIPVIFQSAKNELKDMTFGFSLGAVDYITKPIQGELLQARVKAHVSLKQSRELLAQHVIQLEETAKLKDEIEKITQHDLKGPLASILFLAEKISDKAIATPIKNTVNNVIGMVNLSLEIFKIEQGNYELKAEKTDISLIVKQAISAISIEAGHKNIEIKFTELNGNNNVFIEPLLTMSVLNNIFKNAVEAAPDNSELVISIVEENQKIIIQCQNDGVIPKELRATLFEKYATGNKKQGTGLGTYSAKLMTEAQNGKIWFETIDSKKTIFNIELPTTS